MVLETFRWISTTLDVFEWRNSTHKCITIKLITQILKIGLSKLIWWCTSSDLTTCQLYNFYSTNAFVNFITGWINFLNNPDRSWNVRIVTQFKQKNAREPHIKPSKSGFSRTCICTAILITCAVIYWQFNYCYYPRNRTW